MLICSDYSQKKRRMRCAYAFYTAYEIMTAATSSDQTARFLSHLYPLFCPRFSFYPLNDKNIVPLLSVSN